MKAVMRMDKVWEVDGVEVRFMGGGWFVEIESPCWGRPGPNKVGMQHETAKKIARLIIHADAPK